MTGSKKEVVDIECSNCEKSKRESNYYLSMNPLVASGRLNVCKPCINEHIGDKESDGYLDRVKTILAMMNRPLINDLWRDMDGDWGKYIRPVSSFPQYSSLTFKDSNFINNSNLLEDKYDSIRDSVDESEIEDLEDLIKFWGRGHSLEDIIFLQDEFERLISSYECDTYAMEMIFQEVSHLRLSINKRRQKGDQVDKELKALQDLLGSANIKPVQETGANAAEQSTFGTLIKQWENERPIPEPDKAWEDVDGIKKYINTWFFGQLTRMLGMRGDHTEEFEEELEKYTVKPPEYEDGDIE